MHLIGERLYCVDWGGGGARLNCVDWWGVLILCGLGDAYTVCIHWGPLILCELGVLILCELGGAYIM